MKNLLLFLLTLLSLTAFAQSGSEALPLPDSLAGRLKEYNRLDTKRAEVLDQAVMFYYHQAMAKDRSLLDEGEFYIKELESLSNVIKDRYWLAYSKYYYGLYALERYEYGECILYLKQALHIAETLPKGKGTERLIAEIYVTLSGCYADWNMLPEGLECVNAGLSYAGKANFANVQRALLGNKGVILFKMGRFQDCIINYKELGINNFDADWLNNMAAAYRELKEYDSCIRYCDSVLKLDCSYVQMAESYQRKGNCLAEFGRLEEAEQQYMKAQEIVNEYKDNRLQGIQYFYLSDLNGRKEQFDEALSYADSSILYLGATNDDDLLRQALSLKADILKEMKQPELEAECLRMVMRITDSIWEVKNIKKVDELNWQKDILNLDAQYQVEKNLLQQRSRYLVLLACSIAVFSAIIIVLSLKNRKQKETLLQQELELRNREITAKTMDKMQNNEMLSEVIEKLTEKEQNPEKNVLPSAIRDLKSMLDADTKKDFDLHFVQVHPNFYENLLADFPNLTVNDLRLCAFIKSNLNTKDIAALNNMSSDSVKNARSRLRKKLGLTDHDVSLLGFLSKY